MGTVPAKVVAAGPRHYDTRRPYLEIRSVNAADGGPAGDSNAGRVLVVLCTFNERENLPALVPEVLAADPRLDVLVVDDASPDGTGELADDLAAADPRVRVLHRAGKLGLGTATLAGMTEGVRRGCVGVLTMDADFSHHPKYLPDLLAAFAGTGNGPTADVVIGSRYARGGGIEGWPLKRHLMSRSINVYSRLFLGLRQRDCSGAFRLYRTSILRRIDPDAVRSRGYAFQEEFLFRCRRAGARIVETPVTFADRQIGSSKINAREAVAALVTLGRVGLFERPTSPARRGGGQPDHSWECSSAGNAPSRTSAT